MAIMVLLPFMVLLLLWIYNLLLLQFCYFYSSATFIVLLLYGFTTFMVLLPCRAISSYGSTRANFKLILILILILYR